MRKKKYYLKLPTKILIALAVIVISIIIFKLFKGDAWLRYLFGGKTYSNKDFGIEDYISSRDADGDGIDDQTDILQNARKYVATKPVYKSEYYSGGYPNDGFGVCTDVVAQGFLNAGYDLMELVSEDIKNNPDGYESDVGDKNIDFRRVRNLLVYFHHTADELTTDIYDIKQWQGGDIIVFKGHIGIVSDKRNRKGIPLVIHHGSETQNEYEQDILELREDQIVAHFRIKGD